MSIQETRGYNLRTYRQGDEVDLIFLFNKVYGYCAGFVPRTLEYWRWCIQSRPAFSEEGIAVVTNADKAVGYAVVEKGGNILEFCYDPNYEGKTIVSMLLRWCIDYVRGQGGNSISLDAPVQDDLVRQVCQELEFTEDSFERAVGTLFLRVLDIPELLRKIVAEKKKVKEDFDETISINLGKAPSWCDDYVIMRIREGEMTVLKEKIGTPTIRIDADISTISSCIFGSTRRLYGAIMKRRLKVHPFRKVPRAVKIFSLLQLKNPLYIPRADYG